MPRYGDDHRGVHSIRCTDDPIDWFANLDHCVDDEVMRPEGLGDLFNCGFGAPRVDWIWREKATELWSERYRWRAYDMSQREFPLVCFGERSNRLNVFGFDV